MNYLVIGGNNIMFIIVHNALSCLFSLLYLVFCNNSLQRVIGDLFCIDEQKLQLLDCLENHPHHYVRQDISVTLIKKDELASIDLLNEMCCCSNLAIASDFTCQAYFIEDFTEYLLNYKHYESYKDGIDDKSYVKPEHRPEGYWRDYYHALHKQPLNGF